MKKIARLTPFLLTLFAVSAVYGASPVVNITVKQRPGAKIVKQVTTDSSGNFSIGSLPPGSYTLEFRSQKSADVRNKQFSIALDGTKASGKQSVAGNSLVGGVAVNMEVEPKANVSGQVTTGPTAAQKKKMIWVPPMLGSNMPGRYVEEGSAEHMASKARGSNRPGQRSEDAGQRSQPGGVNRHNGYWRICDDQLRGLSWTHYRRRGSNPHTLASTGF
jgi:hypothetical protein